MGYYRPRPSTTKVCQHCGMQFETKHKRTIYCGESCRQLAYQARQYLGEQAPAKVNAKTKADLNFSMQNVGVAATGAAAVAVGNFLFNDRPAHQEILERLNRIEQGTELDLNQILQAAQLMVDYVNVQVEQDPTLQVRLEQRRAQRAINQARKKEQVLTKLLGQKRKP